MEAARTLGSKKGEFRAVVLGGTWDAELRGILVRVLCSWFLFQTYRFGVHSLASGDEMLLEFVSRLEDASG